MTFEYYMPTKIVCGRGCVTEQARLFLPLGKHALIVTGRSSERNGSLRDVQSALSENGQAYTLFQRVTPNPTVACVREGVALFKSCGADFIVAIGGGSPMDAAKAIATLAVQDRADEEIFAGGYRDIAAPMAHVPTTAGTGSEVTPYAILTNDQKETKTSITSAAMFPRVAFLDGAYTQSLPKNITVNTALDAFSHAAEGILSYRSTPLSDALACECLKILFPLLRELRKKESSLEERDKLLYSSTLAGMTIAQSGTTAVHGMGYYLTYFYAIDHGRANGLLLGETLRLCEEKGLQEVKTICSACGCRGVEEICAVIDGLLGARESLPKERLSEFAARSMGNKNIKKSRYEPTEGEISAIYLRSFGYNN